MLSLKLALALAGALSGASAALINHDLYGRELLPRAAANGSCISAPDNSCVSLVGLCVATIASGRVSDVAVIHIDLIVTCFGHRFLRHNSGATGCALLQPHALVYVQLFCSRWMV